MLLLLLLILALLLPSHKQPRCRSDTDRTSLRKEGASLLMTLCQQFPNFLSPRLFSLAITGVVYPNHNQHHWATKLIDVDVSACVDIDVDGAATVMFAGGIIMIRLHPILIHLQLPTRPFLRPFLGPFLGGRAVHADGRLGGTGRHMVRHIHIYRRVPDLSLLAPQSRYGDKIGIRLEKL